MQKYKEVPHWWYGILFVLAFVAGIIVCSKGDTTLPIWAYLIAILVGVVLAPFSCSLYAMMGNGISTDAISKMIGGVLQPGELTSSSFLLTLSFSLGLFKLSVQLNTFQFLRLALLQVNQSPFSTSLLGLIK